MTLKNSKNPLSPKLYGLKHHKHGAPIRPIVSFTNTHTRSLVIKLNSHFKYFTNFKSHFIISSSIEPTELLKQQNIPGNGIQFHLMVQYVKVAKYSNNKMFIFNLSHP